MAADTSSVVIHYHGHAVHCRDNETVLEALLRAGVDIEFSCKSGVCHRCMVRCIEGEMPEKARIKLPKHQQDTGCMLACQCRPTGNMMLAPKSPEDMVTRCIGSSLSKTDAGQWSLSFEPVRVLRHQAGQLARLMDQDMNGACMATFVSSSGGDEMATVEFDQDIELPAWLPRAPAAVEEFEFCLRGPLPVEPKEPIIPIPADPALWDELGGDEKVRAVLTLFYQKVFADPELVPFFERVTMDRIIGKQFAFLKENIQGIPVYLGEQPRNSHNWMVINDALFDHRQNLMLQAMREHNIPDDLIARWTIYEEQFRPEIVKYKPWPKRYGDLVVDTEQYETCLLDEATVCDYCGGEIPSGTMVRFHKRLGKLGCESCSTATCGTAS